MKERQVVLMLNEEQTDILNATIDSRIEMLEENIEMCDVDDENDAENYRAYQKEILVLHHLKEQLNPR